MINIPYLDDLEWIVETYFKKPDRFISLKKDEILLKQGEKNNRLYFVHEGVFLGTRYDGDKTIEMFRAEKNAFLGLHSFFSKSYKSLTEVKAITDARISYINYDDVSINYKGRKTFEEQFMPIVIVEMLKRQQNELSLFREKEATFKQLIEREKLASLGQMAAGIAHELNNSIAVLYSSANWLLEKITYYWQDQKETAVFEAGLMSGRHLSSKEKRDLQKIWQEKYKIDSSSSRALAQTGLSVEKILQLTDDPKKDARRLSTLWEIGATLNDMRIAAQQSTHVVKSVKLLGAQTNRREELININETIQNTLTLYHQKLRIVDLETELHDLPYIMGNSGEFVQVWSNLIKNALEAMLGAKTEKPVLKIKSKIQNKLIIITFQDNGPGIPENIQQSIFNPNVTTKVSGMSFGLGLGLPIARRIVQSYSGDIWFTTSQQGTTFKVKLPAEVKK